MFEYEMGQAYHVIYADNIADIKEFAFFNSNDLPDSLPVFFCTAASLEAIYGKSLENIIKNAQKMNLAIEIQDTGSISENIHLGTRFTADNLRWYISTMYNNGGYCTRYGTNYNKGKEIIVSESDDAEAVNKKIKPVLTFFNDLFGTDFTLN
jgi:hypothetical protein